MRTIRPVLVGLAAVGALALSACAPESSAPASSSAAAAVDCTPAKLQTQVAEKLTVATGQPPTSPGSWTTTRRTARDTSRPWPMRWQATRL